MPHNENRPAPQAVNMWAVFADAGAMVTPPCWTRESAESLLAERQAARVPGTYHVAPVTVLPDTAPLPAAVVARALAEAPGYERSCEDCLGTGERDVGDTTEPCADCGGSGRVRVIVALTTPRPAPEATALLDAVRAVDRVAHTTANGDYVVTRDAYLALYRAAGLGPRPAPAGEVE